MSRLITYLSTRKCRGFNDPSVHSHHLTWIGRWRFTSWRPWAWR